MGWLTRPLVERYTANFDVTRTFGPHIFSFTGHHASGWATEIAPTMYIFILKNYILAVCKKDKIPVCKEGETSCM